MGVAGMDLWRCRGGFVRMLAGWICRGAGMGVWKCWDGFVGANGLICQAAPKKAEMICGDLFFNLFIEMYLYLLLVLVQGQGRPIAAPAWRDDINALG